MRESSVAPVSVIEERAVAIYERVDPLMEDMGDSARLECGGKLCAMRVLNAMHRPKDLYDTVEDDVITRLFARMICGEAAVVGRMPIFGRNDDIKARPC